MASILRQARDAAGSTARSLDESHSGAVDKLTDVIWKRAGAPLITYDASRPAFTGRLSQQVAYETVRVVPGGGSDTVSRCYRITRSAPAPAESTRPPSRLPRLPAEPGASSAPGHSCHGGARAL